MALYEGKFNRSFCSCFLSVFDIVYWSLDFSNTDFRLKKTGKRIMKRFRFRDVFLMIGLWEPRVKLKSEILPNINNSVLSARDIRSPLNPNEWPRFTHAHARPINWPSADVIWGPNIQQWVSYLNHIPILSPSLVSFSRDYLNYTFWSANWLNNQDKIRLRRSARPHRMHW